VSSKGITATRAGLAGSGEAFPGRYSNSTVRVTTQPTSNKGNKLHQDKRCLFI
jgi:hypothetical protein